MNKLAISVSLLCAAVLSACGGGDGQTTNDNKVTAVKVAGASLSDSGTFGYKFTVQPAGQTKYSVYSELVAAGYGVSSLCPMYTFTGTSFAAHAGCTNYAVAGAKVNNYDKTYAAVVESAPTSIIKQLQDMGAGGFTSHDLVIVGEASSNDAAALATAYLTAPADFTALVSSLITPGSSDPVVLGTQYMQALADKLVAAVEANTLDKGAKRVAVVNTLDVTRTPKFQAALAQVALAYGGGDAGAAAAAQVQQLVQAWVQAYNARLSADVAASRYAAQMAVVDMYTGFNQELAAPSQFGLTNTSATICDLIVTSGAAPGDTSLSTPAVVGQCNDAAAAALNLNGSATGWNRYLFADSFHPTPYGHQLLSLVYMQTLTAKGWN